MKTILKYVIGAAAILCASIILGTLMLLLVFKLPTEEMKNNVQRSTAIYDYESVYPQLMAGYKMSQLDNSTDAIMLLNAITPPKSYKDAMWVVRTEYYDRNPVGSLTDYANDVAGESYTDTYPRYWHGYLVILKPLLLFFDVSDIRVFNMFIQFSLLLYIIMLMIQKELKQYLLPFFVAMLLMNPLTLPLSFQFSTVSYIMMLAVIVSLKKKEWKSEHKMAFFLLIGIATAYFDFLTFPLVGLYFPMIFLLMREKSWKESCKLVITGSISWITGYGCMWAGKFFMGSLITGYNIFKNALSRANGYTNMQYNGEKVNYIQVIYKNMQVLMKYPILILGIVILIYYIMYLFRAKKANKLSVIEYVPFAIIAIAPICWYMVAGTHSYIHYWFTYRELCVCAFALLTGVVKVSSPPFPELMQ